MSQTAPVITLLKLESVQVRDELDQAFVKKYVEAIEEGVNLPPVVVFEIEDKKRVLVDGGHRLAAARKAGKDSFPFELRKGTRADAVRFALQANNTHGCPDSVKDKQRKMTLALATFSKPPLSDRDIAKLCGVANSTVTRYKEKLHCGAPQRKDDSKPKDEENKSKDDEKRQDDKPKTGPPSKPTQNDTKTGAKAVILPLLLDDTGYPIPYHINPTLKVYHENTKAKVLEELAIVSAQRARYDKLQTTDDPSWINKGKSNTPDFGSALCDANNIYRTIKLAYPYAVCPTCKGLAPDGQCAPCGSSGFVSEFYYKSGCVTVEQKAMRESHAKDLIDAHNEKVKANQ